MFFHLLGLLLLGWLRFILLSLGSSMLGLSGLGSDGIAWLLLLLDPVSSDSMPAHHDLVDRDAAAVELVGALELLELWVAVVTLIEGV